MRHLIRAAQGQEVLCAFDRFLKATKELLQIFAALDEIDFGSIDDQQVGSGITKEKVFVGASDFFDVFGGNLFFFLGFFLGDSGAQDFRFGLQVNHQIGFGEFGGDGFVVAFVKFEFRVIEIQIGENAVFFHEEIADDGTGRVSRHGLADAFLALDQEVHLGAESGAAFCSIEIGQKRIVFAIIDAPGMQTFSEDAGEGRFADAQRALDHDKARRLRTALRLKSPFRRRRFRRRHFSPAKVFSPIAGDYSRSSVNILRDLFRVSTKVPGPGRGRRAVKVPAKNVTNGPVTPVPKYSKVVVVAAE